MNSRAATLERGQAAAQKPLFCLNWIRESWWLGRATVGSEAICEPWDGGSGDGDPCAPPAAASRPGGSRGHILAQWAFVPNSFVQQLAGAKDQALSPVPPVPHNGAGRRSCSGPGPAAAGAGCRGTRVLQGAGLGAAGRGAPSLWGEVACRR